MEDFYCKRIDYAATAGAEVASLYMVYAAVTTNPLRITPTIEETGNPPLWNKVSINSYPFPAVAALEEGLGVFAAQPVSPPLRA